MVVAQVSDCAGEFAEVLPRMAVDRKSVGTAAACRAHRTVHCVAALCRRRVLEELWRLWLEGNICGRARLNEGGAEDRPCIASAW
jgi:hypothetical protein